MNVERAVKITEYLRTRAVDYHLNPDSMYVMGAVYCACQNPAFPNLAEQDYLASLGIKDNPIREAIDNSRLSFLELKDKYGSDFNPYNLSLAVYVLLLEALMSIDEDGNKIALRGNIHSAMETYGDESHEVLDVIGKITFIKCFCVWNKIPPPKPFQYMCRGNSNDKYSLFSNVLSETEDSVTLERFQKWGSKRLQNMTMPREDFEYYYIEYDDQIEVPEKGANHNE